MSRRGNGIEQTSQQRQRNHGGLIDDHDIVGQWVVGVMTETNRTGPIAEESMDRARFGIEQTIGEHCSTIEWKLPHQCSRRGNGFTHTGRGLTGWRGEGDAQIGVRVKQHGEKGSDGVGLARARSADDDREGTIEAATHCGPLFSRQLHLFEELLGTRRERAGSGRGGTLEHLLRDAGLEIAIALQIQEIAVQYEGTADGVGGEITLE